MLRDNGAWCRLEVEDRFFVHVGWDQHVYVGSTVPCERAVAFTHERGLFAERITQSPHDPELAEDDVGDRRAADTQFWSELTTLAMERGAVVLEEGFVHNASRWHRLTAEDVDTVRTQITPRSRLLVWPDLSPDVEVALAGLPPDGVSEIVWLDRGGRITNRCVDETDYVDLPTLLPDAQAAMVLSGYADERHPLLSAVMPDPDGVLRARWAP